MAKELASITASCEAFIQSLEEGRYYDAHEDLEQIWFPRRFEDDNEVKLWKGFINAAVCFELIKLGRTKPSESAWQTYLKYRALLETIVTPDKELYVKISIIIERQRSKLCLNF